MELRCKNAGRTRPVAVPGYEHVALVLQGGGALGAYQAGVYRALDELALRPNWVAGISIGAVNAAIIAGSPPELRVSRLEEFWRSISHDSWGPGPPAGDGLRRVPKHLVALHPPPLGNHTHLPPPHARPRQAAPPSTPAPQH